MGICRAYIRRVQTCSSDIQRLRNLALGSEISKNKTELASLVGQPKTWLAHLTTAMPLTVRRTPRTGQGFIEQRLAVAKALPLQMVLIPEGSFVMGSANNELDRDDDESPQHEVTVPSFFMGRYPITQAQWRAIAALPPENTKLDPAPSNFKGDNHPVEQVSWDDATEFCARLAKLIGLPYRLPTEAEWEYACRAGTTTPFYFGHTLTDELANYNASETYANGPQGEYRGATTPVDHFGLANAFGLSDMHGNVWEWCQDHWHSDYKGAPADETAWTEGGDDSRRVIRGGAWDYIPWGCRSAFRDYFSREDHFTYTGFRVSCSSPRT